MSSTLWKPRCLTLSDWPATRGGRGHAKNEQFACTYISRLQPETLCRITASVIEGIGGVTKLALGAANPIEPLGQNFHAQPDEKRPRVWMGAPEARRCGNRRSANARP